MDEMDPIERLIKVWHDAGLEFAQKLEDFINNLPDERANFWGIDLWLFLQHQRDQGMKVDQASYLRLRAVLDEFRDELIADGVELQQTYTPSPAQIARERASIRARNERATPSPGSYRGVFAAVAAAAQTQTLAPTGPAPKLRESEIRYWIESLRPLIRVILENYPPEQWVKKVKEALARIKPPQEIADKVIEWITEESDKLLRLKWIFDALHQAAENPELVIQAELGPLAELADLAVELTLGLKELAADGKPERLFEVMQKLIERFPALVPDALRTEDLDALLTEVQQFMREFMDFLAVLPPEAYALIPDLLQTMLDLVGLIPGLGEIADAISAVFSYFRGEYGDMVLSLGSLIPALGTIPGVGKILRRLRALGKSVIKMGKGPAREVLQALLKFWIDEAGQINLSFEWFKKFLERFRKKLGELTDKLRKTDGPSGKPRTPPDASSKPSGSPRQTGTETRREPAKPSGRRPIKFGPGDITKGKNFDKKIRKHIDQVRKRHGRPEDIPKPGQGGVERVWEIIKSRVAKGGGRQTTYAGEPAVAFADGRVTYIFHENGEFWTILAN